MDTAVSNTVNQALALQQFQFGQEKDMLLLKKVLNSQADTLAQLMQSMPPLAVEGTLGTRVNTYA